RGLRSARASQSQGSWGHRRHRAENMGRAGKALWSISLWAALASAAAADDLRLSYKLDEIGDVAGGLRKTAATIDLRTFGGDFDLEQSLGWRGASASFSINHSNGGSTRSTIGQLQNISSLESDTSATYLFEAWIEQRLSAAFTLKAGLIDANSEFDV